MSCNTEPTAVPIAVHMMAISTMNKSATSNSSGCAGRKPTARQTTNTMLPWISDTVALPSVRPSTLSNRGTGATKVSFRKPTVGGPAPRLGDLPRAWSRPRQHRNAFGNHRRQDGQAGRTVDLAAKIPD